MVLERGEEIVEFVDRACADGIFFDGRSIDFIADATNSIVWFYEMEDVAVDRHIRSLLAEAETVPRLHDFAIDFVCRCDRLVNLFGSVAAAVHIGADFDLMFFRFIHNGFFSGRTAQKAERPLKRD
jgi:hypothetical protein